MLKKKNIYPSLIILLSFMFPFGNKLKSIDHKAYAAYSLSFNIEEKLPYTFKISDKLKGNGEIKLSIDGNKITGQAKGLGKTYECNVDLVTNIHGLFNNLDYIQVNVDGVGDPKGIIPGMIGFSGPLQGHIEDNTITLIGNVNIEGCLAKLGGFKDTEEVIIEIPAKNLIQAYKNKIKENELASI